MSYFTWLQHCLHINDTSVVSRENVLQCVTAYIVVAQLGSSKKSWSNPVWLSQCMFQHSWDNTHLPMSIYTSCNGPRILRVRGYMEMRSTCWQNLITIALSGSSHWLGGLVVTTDSSSSIGFCLRQGWQDCSRSKQSHTSITLMHKHEYPHKDYSYLLCYYR